eukprot:jgi/Botrbrau1/13074/Bobra.0187s0036.1
MMKLCTAQSLSRTHDSPLSWRGCRLQCRGSRAPGRARAYTVQTKCLSNGQGSIVAFGEGLFDCLADQKGVPKEEVKSWTPYPGGAPANVACALATLGDKVAFVSALGEDELGNGLLDLMKSKGVNVAGVQRVDAPTRDVLVVYDAEGDRKFVGFGKTVTTEFADCFIDADKLPIDLLKSAEVIITGTLGLAYPATAQAMNAAVAIVKESGGTVIIDVNWRPVFFEDPEKAPEVVLPYVKQADILKLTDEEADWLLGIPADRALHSPLDVLAKFPDVKGVLVTAGGLGSSFAFRAKQEPLAGYVPVLKVDVVDTTGAGDAFLAGFIHKLIEVGGLDVLREDPAKMREAASFGAACGAYTTTGPGAIAAQPTLKQAQELLRSVGTAKS